MIVEVASIRVAPENAAAFEAAVREAVAVFGRAEGCRGMQLMRGVESPDQYRLLIRWDSLEAHTVGFREGPQSPSGAGWSAATSPSRRAWCTTRRRWRRSTSESRVPPRAREIFQKG